MGRRHMQRLQDSSVILTLRLVSKLFYSMESIWNLVCYGSARSLKVLGHKPSVVIRSDYSSHEPDMKTVNVRHKARRTWDSWRNIDSFESPPAFDPFLFFPPSGQTPAADSSLFSYFQLDLLVCVRVCICLCVAPEEKEPWWILLRTLIFQRSKRSKCPPTLLFSSLLFSSLTHSIRADESISGDSWLHYRWYHRMCTLARNHSSAAMLPSVCTLSSAVHVNLSMHVCQWKCVEHAID